MAPLVCLPVIIVVTEEATSRHINVLLFLLLLLLLSSGSGLSGSSSSSGGGSSSTNTYTLKLYLHMNQCTRGSDHVKKILSSKVGSEHGRPVRSNGVTGGSNDLVQVLLLEISGTINKNER